MSRYQALPVEVEAKRIVDAQPVETLMGLDLIGVHGLVLNLEDGSQFHATPAILARLTPEAGDFVVTQTDGFVTVLPQKAFLRNYHPVDESAPTVSTEQPSSAPSNESKAPEYFELSNDRFQMELGHRRDIEKHIAWKFSLVNEGRWNRNTEEQFKQWQSRESDLLKEFARFYGLHSLQKVFDAPVEKPLTVGGNFEMHEVQQIARNMAGLAYLREIGNLRRASVAESKEIA